MLVTALLPRAPVSSDLRLWMDGCLAQWLPGRAELAVKAMQRAWVLDRVTIVMNTAKVQ